MNCKRITLSHLLPIGALAERKTFLYHSTRTSLREVLFNLYPFTRPYFSGSKGHGTSIHVPDTVHSTYKTPAHHQKL